MIKQIIDDEMEKYAKDYVYDNNVYFLNMMDRWIQRTDYRFPLDIKVLEENSQMRQEDVDARFHPIYEHIQTLPEKDRKTARDKTDEEFLKQSRKASQAESSSKIIMFLKENPEGILKALNAALYDLMVQAGDEEYEDFYPPEFEIINYPKSKINSITFSDIKHLHEVEGWIAYIENPPRIEYTHKYFLCKACRNSLLYEEKPKICDVCGSRDGFIFDPENSKGKKIQELFLIENYDDVESQNTAGIISILVEGTNINKFEIGDRVKIMGIVAIQRKKLNSYLAIKAISCTPSGSENITFTKDDINKIQELAKDPFPFIRRNFARSIIGSEYDILKESLSLAIAGGSRSEKRNNIHILMIGNPGVGKSELLKAVEKDSPKAFYVSDASGPGLTAAIADINGSRVMVPGIMVLANNGIAAVDELDKMRREDTQALHSAMEQGEFVKAKAGLKMKFTTKTTVIAAANPVNSSFDANRTIMEQINMPESLLQRFDVIWIMQGSGNINSEEILTSTEAIDDSILRKYFTYIQKINPGISNVINDISTFFNDLRGKSGDIAINARVLLAMKRIVQASAKMHLRENANMEDVDEMRKIFTAYLKQFNFSVSNIYMPATLRERVWRILDLFKSRKKWEESELRRQSAMEQEEFESCISILKREGKIIESRNGRYELI